MNFQFPGIEPGKPNDETRIERISYADATKDYDICTLRTVAYDSEFRRSCGSHVIRSPQEAINASLHSLQLHRNDVLYYDTYKCNCDHWLTSWKYGLAWTLQVNPWVFWSNKYKSENCLAPGKLQCMYKPGM